MLKFLLKKCEKLLIFFQQKYSEYCVLNPLKQLTKMTLNELVKLTSLWTTGPRCVRQPGFLFDASIFYSCREDCDSFLLILLLFWLVHSCSTGIYHENLVIHDKTSFYMNFKTRDIRISTCQIGKIEGQNNGRICNLTPGVSDILKIL